MRHPRLAGLFVTGVLLSVAPMATADGWGTIKGRAVWADVPLKPAQLNVTKDQNHCLAQGPIFSEAYVINAQNKGVKWVAVYLAKDDDGKADFKAKLPIHAELLKVDKRPIVIDQPRCRFVPNLVILRKGQEFIGKNSSPIVHNMNIQGPNGVNDNLVIPPGGSLTVPANKWMTGPGTPTVVSCGIHGWMKAHVFCLDHPYFAVTDDDGNFEIKNAPAGTYRLIGWHDGWGWTTDTKKQTKFGIEVKIEDGKTTTVTLSVYKSQFD